MSYFFDSDDLGKVILNSQSAILDDWGQAIDFIELYEKTYPNVKVVWVPRTGGTGRIWTGLLFESEEDAIIFKLKWS